MECEWQAGLPAETYMLSSLCCLAAILITIYIFTCRKCADTPWIVIYIWALVDLTLVLSSVSILTWTKDGGIKSQHLLCRICFEISTVGILVMQFVFAMEYFSAVIRLPILMQLFEPDAENRWKKAKCKIQTFNIAFYAAIGIWLLMFHVPISDHVKGILLVWGVLMFEVLVEIMLILSVLRLRALIK